MSSEISGKPGVLCISNVLPEPPFRTPDKLLRPPGLTTVAVHDVVTAVSTFTSSAKSDSK